MRPPRSSFTRDEFYIRIRGYGRNEAWATQMRNVAEDSMSLIKKRGGFDEVLKFIAKGVKAANQLTFDIAKKIRTGNLRTTRAGWETPASSWEGLTLTTQYGQKGSARYNSYESKFDKIKRHPLKNPFKDIELTRPNSKNSKKFLQHAADKYINKAFDYVEELYNSLIDKFLAQEIKPTDLPEINNSIAKIRYILAHATPFERGSDSIANVFMKALYKALGIKTSKPAKGISFDLEAYCNSLADYQKNFPTYFENPPEIIK